MKKDNRITESVSKYSNLEHKSTAELLSDINREDKTVPQAVEKAIPQIEAVVNSVVDALLSGGRLFYIGAGTSGRLGILDASECPPTFGVSDQLIIGLIAGGDGAIRKAVERAEDDEDLAWKDLAPYRPTAADFLLGIAASGTTPYVISGLKQARAHGLGTACITCNPDSLVAQATELPIEVITGPEYVTGSTRMKAGTAQKLVLNMISTSVMIKLGRVKGNRMVDMQLSNDKLVDRGTKMVAEALNISEPEAKARLLKAGSVRLAIDNFQA